MAAVERIEILRDGASAIYGSDAIGGVINIIMRKDFEGMHLSYGLGRPTQTGGDEDSIRRTREDLGVTRPMRLIYNGVDEARFVPAPRGRRTGPFRVLFCGNLNRRKRPELLAPLAQEIEPSGGAATGAEDGGGLAGSGGTVDAELQKQIQAENSKLLKYAAEIIGKLNDIHQSADGAAGGASRSPWASVSASGRRSTKAGMCAMRGAGSTSARVASGRP